MSEHKAHDVYCCHMHRAAPQMYAALKGIAGEVSGIDTGDPEYNAIFDRIFKTAQAALAAAEGGE